VLVATGVAATAYGVADYPDPFLPLGVLVALYTVVALCSRTTAVAVGAVTLGAAWAATALAGDSDALDYYAAAVAPALAWVLGDRAAGLRRAREREAERAVHDERVRIARELHDVVAHHVSVMVVQAEAGACLPSPEEREKALDAVAGTGREAMAELRRLLAVLHDDTAAATAPQPGLGDVEGLVRSVQEAGVPVDLEVVGSIRALPEGVDLSAYRIVQEALTNTVRHAGPARARVVIRYLADGLELEVTDDGRGPVVSGNGASGRGLAGMRERAGLFGGSVVTGPRPGGGFVVSARLPVPP
jgi:signal transduction histidine kinase